MSRGMWVACALAMWAVGCTDDDTGGKETGALSAEDQIKAGLFVLPASNAAVQDPEAFGQTDTTFDGITIGAYFYMYVTAIDVPAESIAATTSWDTETSATTGRSPLPPASPTRSSCTGTYSSLAFNLSGCTQYTTVDVPAEKLLPDGDGLMTLELANIAGTFGADGTTVDDGTTVEAQLDLASLDDDLERFGSGLCSDTLTCVECKETELDTCISIQMVLGAGTQIEGESL